MILYTKLYSKLLKNWSWRNHRTFSTIFVINTMFTPMFTPTFIKIGDLKYDLCWNVVFIYGGCQPFMYILLCKMSHYRTGLLPLQI